MAAREGGSPHVCGFCLRTASEVPLLIAGKSSFICVYCVVDCAGVMAARLSDGTARDESDRDGEPATEQEAS